MIEARDAIRQFILDEFVYADDVGKSLKDDVSLLDEGIFDSVGILSVIGFLEERFKIEVEDHEVIPDNLESVDAITVFVQRKQKNGGCNKPTRQLLISGRNGSSLSLSAPSVNGLFNSTGS